MAVVIISIKTLVLFKNLTFYNFYNKALFLYLFGAKHRCVSSVTPIKKHFQLIIDSMDTRLSNPAASTIRKMVGKDGFDENMRMEMHEDAEKSTYSVDEEDADDDTGSEMSQSMPNETVDSDNRAQASQMSNKTIEIQGFSPLQPRMVSTPEVPVQNEAMERTKNEILANLGEVQKLCENTMAEVRTLRTKCSKTEIDTNTLKVN